MDLDRQPEQPALSTRTGLNKWPMLASRAKQKRQAIPKGPPGSSPNGFTGFASKRCLTMSGRAQNTWSSTVLVARWSARGCRGRKPRSKPSRASKDRATRPSLAGGARQAARWPACSTARSFKGSNSTISTRSDRCIALRWSCLPCSHARKNSAMSAVRNFCSPQSPASRSGRGSAWPCMARKCYRAAGTRARCSAPTQRPLRPAYCSTSMRRALKTRSASPARNRQA